MFETNGLRTRFFRLGFQSQLKKKKRKKKRNSLFSCFVYQIGRDVQKTPFSDYPSVIPQLASSVLRDKVSSVEQAASSASGSGISTLVEGLQAGHGRISFCFVCDLFHKAVKK